MQVRNHCLIERFFGIQGAPGEQDDFDTRVSLGPAGRNNPSVRLVQVQHDIAIVIGDFQRGKKSVLDSFEDACLVAFRPGACGDPTAWHGILLESSRSCRCAGWARRNAPSPTLRSLPHAMTRCGNNSTIWIALSAAPFRS